MDPSSEREAHMQTEKFYHKCGYPILMVKKQVGLVAEQFYLDGEKPFIEARDGKKSPNLIKQCPECRGTVVPEKLLTQKPDTSKEKRPSGYIPARMGS